MPRCVYFRASKESLEARLRAVLATEANPKWTVESRTEKAMEEFDRLKTLPRGLFDQEFVVKYDDIEPLNVDSETMDAMGKWAFELDWEVIQSSDLDRAATKIQGQARRRRDANRVKQIHQERSKQE